MTPGDERANRGPEDAARYARVQQANQALLASKLLHDLRNPLHAVRIAVELFHRIADAGEQGCTKLLPRAERYVGPAQIALESLSKQTERLALCLSPPAEPALEAVGVADFLRNAAELLTDSKQNRRVDVDLNVPDGLNVLADLPRLFHGVVAWCLRAGDRVVIRATQDADRVEISASCPLGSEDIERLLERAGGEWRREEGAAAAIRFSTRS